MRPVRTASMVGGVWLVAALLRAGTIYVNAAAAGANDGSSWANAYTSLQPALTAAVSADEIWVAVGTYKPTATTDRTISFVLKNGVGVYGGFVGTETLRSQRDPVAHVTTLSGAVGAISNGSYHVVTADAAVTATGVIDGFTITGGNATGAGANQDRGGGMWINGGTVTVSHCVFSGNTANELGGGLRVTSASPSIDGCIFTGDYAAAGGAGIGAGAGSSFTVKNTIFRSNTTADTRGAGIDADSGVTAVNCVFQGNTGNGLRYGSSGTVINSTFTGNSSYGAAFIADGTVINSILWNDAIDEVFIGFGTIAVTYSDVGGSGFNGVGNKSVDPLFRNAGANDLRLGRLSRRRRGEEHGGAGRCHDRRGGAASLLRRPRGRRRRIRCGSHRRHGRVRARAIVRYGSQPITPVGLRRKLDRLLGDGERQRAVHVPLAAQHDQPRERRIDLRRPPHGARDQPHGDGRHGNV